MNRRSLLGGAALAATTALVIRQSKASHVPHRRPRLSHVAVLRCDRYERAPQVVEQGLQLVRPSVHGKRVLLKPNLVEYSPAAPINTHPMLIASVIDALYSLGAASVIVAEGPGNIRDTDLLLDESGLRAQLEILKRARFVDLNFDSVTRVVPGTGLTHLKELWLPGMDSNHDSRLQRPLSYH